MKLMQKYFERKCLNDEFEVIEIGGKVEEVVPWFKMPHSSDWLDGAYKNVKNIFSEILLRKGYGVFVFDRDGKVARATINRERLDFEASDFPFCGGRLEAEVVYDLSRTCNWILY
ncbi:hypothetical protein POM88_009502 [Heracleum sosnowskyi]|uniref:Uncharacterized protein n=1 Tax=Heracleum sosnowskyi TaxID=360622 RepID=A0AAD8J8V2_9APIA|nr:hypothetical protein POM88_009502 [Heracleum sosnowskyi]